MLTTLVQPVFIAVLVVLEVAVWQLASRLPPCSAPTRRPIPTGCVNAVLSVLALGRS